MIFITYSLIIFLLIALLRNKIRNSKNINHKSLPRNLIYIYFYQKILSSFQLLGFFLFLTKVTPLKKYFLINSIRLTIYHFIYSLNSVLKEIGLPENKFNINFHTNIINSLMFLDTIKIS